MTQETYDAFMLDHAAGALPPALRVAGDLHRALDADGAAHGAIWDQIGGALLDQVLELESVGTGTAGDTATCPPPARSQRAPRRPVHRPASIGANDIIDTDLDALTWRRGLSGVQFAPADLANGQFMRLAAGQRTPAHGHSAMEATVVLRGSLVIDDTTYTVGQLVLGVPGERHQPIGGNCSECICYVGRESRPFWRFS